ncbi:phage baseplate assembly protein V [Janthinobacterium sp. BJB401]|uniref:phage baseplate assembly protein V n=1 Tax=Janthinobacterium sp. BJB401 TaxID=2745934 RepID=UPI00159609D0|nr:phage baseplate assembly protein V [Janthinobacterium sp. BJB401]
MAEPSHTARQQHAHLVGEQVIIFSPGGDMTRGIILPSLYSQEFNTPDTSDSIHTTHYPDSQAARRYRQHHGQQGHVERAQHHLHGRPDRHEKPDRQAIGHNGRCHLPEWRGERHGWRRKA